MQNSEIITLIFKTAVWILLVLFYSNIKPAIDAWIDEKMDKQLKDIIFDAVKAAEQTIEDNSEKKLWVTTTVTNKLKKLNINITPMELSDLIESAVYGMKNYI